MSKDKPLRIRNSTAGFLIFTRQAGVAGLEVGVAEETVWLTQKLISVLLDKGRSTITEHLKNIFDSGELAEAAVCRDFRHTAEDGKDYTTRFYNLDAIIAAGFRVNSTRATQFRQWATGVLRDFVIHQHAQMISTRPEAPARRIRVNASGKFTATTGFEAGGSAFVIRPSSFDLRPVLWSDPTKVPAMAFAKAKTKQLAAFPADAAAKTANSHIESLPKPLNSTPLEIRVANLCYESCPSLRDMQAASFTANLRQVSEVFFAQDQGTRAARCLSEKRGDERHPRPELGASFRQPVGPDAL